MTRTRRNNYFCTKFFAINFRDGFVSRRRYHAPPALLNLWRNNIDPLKVNAAEWFAIVQSVARVKKLYIFRSLFPVFGRSRFSPLADVWHFIVRTTGSQTRTTPFKIDVDANRPTTSMYVQIYGYKKSTTHTFVVRYLIAHRWHIEALLFRN